MLLVGAYMVNMAMVWLVVMIVLLVIEGVVPGLISIWFALGALAAIIAAAVGAPLWLQVVWFLLVSVVTLALTRPLAKKYINSRAQPTNADVIIGRECLVTEDIDNLLGTGQVTVNGMTWTARAEADSLKFLKGDVVTAVRIEGVKLIVSVTV